MAQIEVTWELLVEDAVFILQCLRQNVRGGRTNGLADVQLTLANSVTLDLGDYVAFLRRFGYVDVDRRAVALQLTAQGDQAAIGEARTQVAENVVEHFAPLLAAGKVEVDDIESAAALEDLLRSAGLEPAPKKGIFAEMAAQTGEPPPRSGRRGETDPGFTDPELQPVPTDAPAQLVVRAARLETAEGELGQGALGRVRAGRWGELGRTVAVKQWKPLQQYLPWLTPQELGRRVLVEARAQAQLNHPCVMPVLDVLTTRPGGEGPLLVMPLAAGGSLRAKLSQKLPLLQALRAGAQVSHALSQAHASGLTHTSIKPENVLFDGRGNTLLSDFGGARLVQAPQPANGERAPRVSVDRGDGAYLAPEAATGAALDAAADAYAFGVLLYEILVGHVPGRRAPVPSAVRPEVGRDVDDLIDALLDDDPARRPSMGTAAARLALALGGNPLYLL
jgi:hypothetical protein